MIPCDVCGTTEFVTVNDTPETLCQMCLLVYHPEMAEQIQKFFVEHKGLRLGETLEELGRRKRKARIRRFKVLPVG